MCGIAGKIDFDGAVDPGLIHRMCAVMEHRGPDSRGVHVEDGVGLGMQRLAIIDVAGGEQPIFNEDGMLVLVMNGEIYNFEALRAELIRRGHRLASRVDAEVIVHLYEDHGEDLVRHLRGMFAFALWDGRRRRLLCARDRIGKKPLFWARKGAQVWFGSEIRALLEDRELDRRIDPDAIDAYLALQYVPHPLSAFAEIRKLSPASTLTITEDGEAVERYWALDYSQKLEGVSRPELEQQLRAHIREATRIRLMSEVPLGAFLSGGVDSSAVVAAMAEQMSEPVRTFSIGFADADFDELKYARMVAQRFSTDHHEFRVEPEALTIMPKLVRHYGEPYGDSSAIPSFYLAELTSRHVTVALNGDGGDESFAGYSRYTAESVAAKLGWLPPPLKRVAPRLAALLPQDGGSNDIPARLRRLAARLAMSPEARWASWMSIFDIDRRSRMLTPEFRARLGGGAAERFIAEQWRRSTALSEVDVMLDVDVNTYLPGDLLVKMDIATMAYSVEARSPFLDQELMQFAASLPIAAKLKGREGKHILRSAMRGVLPDAVLDRKKMGFGVPLVRWFREDLRHLPEEVLLDPQALARGYFERAEIERIIREHQRSHADHALQLWTLLALEMWHREVVEAPPLRAEVVG
ncbi:MAG: asparagine synthase (glutamine-hydrolyzing) [Solirubrobacterales bacterium]|nr:asparagine synthase (glutamine-hydrolyzing) [Solirubrobacterales bacterium]